MGTNGKEDVVTAAVLKASARKTIHAPSGNVYRIRRVKAFLFIGIHGGPPSFDLSDPTLPSEDRLALKATSDRQRAEYQERMEAILAAGLESPRVGAGEDEIEVADIPHGDLACLFEEIIALAGASKRDGEALRPTQDGATSSSDSTGSPVATDAGHQTSPEPETTATS